jgi:hypothetical protein
VTRIPGRSSVPRGYRRFLEKGDGFVNQIITFSKLGHVIGLAVLAVVVVLAALAWLDSANRHRIHAENLKNAERFSQEFQSAFRSGATSTSVDEYLRARSVVDVLPQSRGDKTEYWVTLVRERSVVFGCGDGSVGLVLLFAADHSLESVRVSSWSMDCL